MDVLEWNHGDAQGFQVKNTEEKSGDWEGLLMQSAWRL
jgi:hypothetical protein